MTRQSRQEGEGPVDLEESLVRFYDQEAPQRFRRPLPLERIRERSRFVQLLAAEGRQTVVDIGAGAGHDAVALAKGKLRVSAVDLSTEHAALCRSQGIEALVANAARLPLASGSFDAGWTMSTLLHVPNTGIDAAMREIGRVLEPGAPLAVGLWGGDQGEHVLEVDRFDPPRFFAIRTDDEVMAMLSRFGTIESFTTWPSPTDPDEHYQFAVVRT